MVSVPVLSPRCQLKRAEPPYVLAGIDAFGQSRFQVKKTVDEGLHMKTVDKPDRADPKEAGPAKQEIAKTDRNEDQRNLELAPNRVSRLDQIRTPLFHRRRPPLIQPSEMGPPEPAMTGAGHVFDRIGLRVVISMVRYPRARHARTIEHGCEDEHLFDNRIEFHGSMGESAVVRHSRPQRTCAREAQTPQKYSPSRNGEQRDSDESESVDGDDVNERPGILRLDVPPWKCPRMTFAKPRAGLYSKIAPPHRPKRPERPPPKRKSSNIFKFMDTCLVFNLRKVLTLQGWKLSQLLCANRMV